MMKKIDIWGPCSLRDTFTIHKELNNYLQVNKFYQSNSVLTINDIALSSIIGKRLTYEDFSATSHCWFEWFDTNAEATLYDKMTLNPANYLLFSAIECMYGYHNLKNANYEFRLCPSMGIANNNILEKINLNFEFVNFLKLDLEKIKKYIHLHIKKITKIYKEKDIIIVDIYPANFYLKDHKIYKFYKDEDFDILVNKLEELYKFIHNIFPSAMIIELPSNLIADAHHRWGLGNQHYIKEVYLYIGNSIISLLTDNEPIAMIYNEHKKLALLCAKYINNMYS